jgi:winged helix DNA-binding protein
MIDSAVAQRRLLNQHLVGDPLQKPEDVVRWLGAMQSQDYAGAKWAIAQRVGNVNDAELNRLFDNGSILRTHLLRPTWHFVSPADIRWMLKLTAPRVHAANAYYYRKLELDGPIFRRSNAAIARALKGGKQLTRVELAESLRRAKIDASELRLAYLVMRAELDAIICSGSLRGKQFTYALLDDRAPQGDGFDREAALSELTRRYFASHGPALIQDFAWWSGLTVADAREGVEAAGLLSNSHNGKTYWFGTPTKSAARQKTPLIHLLPNYDEYLIAYKDHRPSFDPALLGADAKNRSAVMAHLIVLDGQVIGGWQRTIEKSAVTIRTKLLVALGRRERSALAEACERYGEFLGKPVKLA